MNSTYHQWKARAQKNPIIHEFNTPWTSEDINQFERKCEKIRLNEKKDRSTITMFILGFIAGIMFGYIWCWHHLGG